LEYRIGNGSSQIWADGVDAPFATVLEAKYIGNPSASPYIEGTSIPDFIRQSAISDVRSEFFRYGQIINDPTTPVVRLKVFVNDPLAVPFFERLLSEFGIPGIIVVKN
jgi:hypothetical protein